MNSKTILDVVIPVLNGEEYIVQCIDSLVQFIPLGINLIIQDGGSTDKTLSIINEYAQKFPGSITVFSQKDKGQSNAINIGLTKGNANWVTWLGHDDILLPDFSLLL
jgi:glycosyltransferase involved in cell wall biosynthesis